MPKSSFFDAVTLPQGAVPGGPIPGGPVPQGIPGQAVPGLAYPGAASQRVNPRLRAYYNNIFGSNANLEWDPTTNKTEASLRAPVGDHQNQFFINAGGYYQPAGAGTPADYGVRLGFEKKIAPEGLSGGELINRVLAPELGVSGTIPASVRSDILSQLSPEKLAELNQRVREEQREEKDRQLGIVPGATKYGYGIGFGGDNSNQGKQQEATNFARNYAGGIGQ